MKNHPRSLAASLLSFALTVLAACWAINWAAQLLLAVWPVVLSVAIGLGLFSAGLGYWRSRDRW